MPDDHPVDFDTRVKVAVYRAIACQSRSGAWDEASSNALPSGTTFDPKPSSNFKFYRQATNKIVGISDQAAAFLRGFF